MVLILAMCCLLLCIPLLSSARLALCLQAWGAHLEQVCQMEKRQYFRDLLTLI